MLELDGHWRVTLDLPMGLREAEFQLQQRGSRFSDTLTDEMGPKGLARGEIRGQEAEFVVAFTGATTLALHFDGRVEGDTLTGSVDVGEDRTGDFRTVRQAQARPQA